MKDQYIKYDLFNLLKKTDFKFKTKFLKFGSKPSSMGSLFDSPIFKKITPKPTQSSVQKWLREIHNIHIEIGMHEFKKWCFAIQSISSPIIDKPQIAQRLTWDINDFHTYEEALEKGLIEALKLI